MALFDRFIGTRSVIALSQSKIRNKLIDIYRKTNLGTHEMCPTDDRPTKSDLDNTYLMKFQQCKYRVCRKCVRMNYGWHFRNVPTSGRFSHILIRCVAGPIRNFSNNRKNNVTLLLIPLRASISHRISITFRCSQFHN